MKVDAYKKLCNATLAHLKGLDLRLDYGLIAHLRSLSKSLYTLEDLFISEDGASTSPAAKRVEARILRLLATKLVREKLVIINAKQAQKVTAAACVKTAKRCLNQAHSYPTDEAGMTAMYVSDAADHLQVGCQLHAGLIGAARRKVRMMDTASYGMLPAKACKLWW